MGQFVYRCVAIYWVDCGLFAVFVHIRLEVIAVGEIQLQTDLLLFFIFSQNIFRIINLSFRYGPPVSRWKLLLLVFNNIFKFNRWLFPLQVLLIVQVKFKITVVVV